MCLELSRRRIDGLIPDGLDIFQSEAAQKILNQPQAAISHRNRRHPIIDAGAQLRGRDTGSDGLRLCCSTAIGLIYGAAAGQPGTAGLPRILGGWTA